MLTRPSNNPVATPLSDGTAGASNVPTEAPATPETGWGGYALKAPLCRECGKSVYQCFCNVPDPDVMPKGGAL